MSTRVSYFITCDICGESAGHSHTESVARQEVRRHGWVRVRDVEGKLVDMCWRCAERAERERDQQREDIRNLKAPLAPLAAANARAEAAEAANARCREANILLANSRNTAAEEWRTRAEAAEADAATCNHYATRALAAEAKLAAVPVEELDRWFEHSDVYRDVRNGRYDQYQAISDREKIDNWLAQQSEVQP